MSSTNRKNAAERHVSDYYVTPVYEVERFLIALNNVDKSVMECNSILDCSAGGDSVNNVMSYPTAIHNLTGKVIDTIDIREDSPSLYKGDYLKFDCKENYDMVISNPPFNLALEFIQKALDDVKEGGWVIMLLRLNFLEGISRKEVLWDNIMPKYIFVHSKRMSFTGDGKTDSIAYAHYVFKKDHKDKFASIMII